MYLQHMRGFNMKTDKKTTTKNKMDSKNTDKLGKKTKLPVINQGMLRLYILASILVFAILLSILQGVLHIPVVIARTVLAIYVVVMIGVYVFMKNRWMRAYMEAIDSLQPLLTHYHDPAYYRKELMALLQFQKATPFRMMLHMGLYASYCVEENWEQAKNELLDAPYKKAFGLQKVAYWTDRAYVDFRLNNDEEAFEIIDKNREDFIKCQNMDRIGALIVIIFIIERIKKGDKQEGKKMFEQLKQQYSQKAIEDKYAYIKSLL